MRVFGKTQTASPTRSARPSASSTSSFVRRRAHSSRLTSNWTRRTSNDRARSRWILLLSLPPPPRSIAYRGARQVTGWIVAQMGKCTTNKSTNRPYGQRHEGWDQAWISAGSDQSRRGRRLLVTMRRLLLCASARSWSQRLRVRPVRGIGKHELSRRITSTERALASRLEISACP